MRKVYESPECKVVLVEKKDVLTASVTTNLFAKFQNGGNGDFDENYGGAYISGKDLFG